MADDKGKFIIFQCCRHSSDKWQFCARYLSVGMIFVDGPIYNDVDWIDDVWTVVPRFKGIIPTKCLTMYI